MPRHKTAPYDFSKDSIDDKFRVYELESEGLENLTFKETISLKDDTVLHFEELDLVKPMVDEWKALFIVAKGDEIKAINKDFWTTCPDVLGYFIDTDGDACVEKNHDGYSDSRDNHATCHYHYSQDIHLDSEDFCDSSDDEVARKDEDISSRDDDVDDLLLVNSDLDTFEAADDLTSCEMFSDHDSLEALDSIASNDLIL